ncbi:MAG TPA: ATP-binding protein [Pyrinomonadaceae bacterium]|nr:ATP-binding protein [Pyrinomonadaceae bacterium]
MTSLNEATDSTKTKEINRLQMLIIGRLLVVFLLLVTSWIWYSGNLELSVENFPRGLFIVFIISVGSTVVYFLLPKLSYRFGWQYWVQFTFDALLITWLIWRTGDLTSPYITLYFVLISISSLFFSPNSTLAMSILCGALFSGLALLISLTAIEGSAASYTTAKIIQIVSFNMVALLVVGFLASRLAKRQFPGEQLAETTKTLANLRALHQRIVESIRSGLITTDLEGTIYTVNSAASEITGRAASEMAGQSIFSFFGNIRAQIEIAKDNQVDLGQLPRFETDLVTPDGFAVHIGYSISLLFSEENEPTGLIITFQDLTQIRSMEESIRRKDRLAAVGRVGAGLAHEIRNPLGAMRGAIQVLESSTPPNSIQSDLMSIILRESDRLNSIITNFLNYARPKTGNFTEVDVCEALQDTVTLLKHGPDYTEKLEVMLDLPEQPVFIQADSTQLKQIFWNLARNAFQAMPDGGRLQITLNRVPASRIRISFEDSGGGMPPEQVEQLFEPFSNSRTGGTGLGLSIVYQIIRDHNGSINVRSAEGEGTTITIELPSESRAEPANSTDSLDGEAPINRFLKVKAKEN